MPIFYIFVHIYIGIIALFMFWPRKANLLLTFIVMLRWMSGYKKYDKIRKTDIREKVGVTLITEKMIALRLRLFRPVWKRPIEAHAVRGKGG